MQNYVYDEKTGSYVPEKEKRKHSNTKWIAILLWAIQFVLPFISGIVAYTYYEKKDQFLHKIAKETLNFSLTLVFYTIVAVILSALSFGLLSFILFPILGAYFIAIPIMGIIKAYNAEVYKPQYSIRLIL